MVSRDEVASMAALIAKMNAVGGDGSYLGAPLPPAPAYGNPMGNLGVGTIDPVTGQPIEFHGSDGNDAAFAAMDAAYDYCEPAYQEPRPYSAQVDDSQVNAMKDIMRRFRETGGIELMNNLTSVANDAAAYVAQQAETQPQVARALQTSRTENGIRVGCWEITVQTENAKRYDVSHVDTGDVIAKDLYIYEAAEALVKHLNEGLPINNQKIQHILRLEMDYARNLDDAVHFKRTCSRALDRGDDVKLNIAKSRFSEARASAIKAKNALMEYLKR